MVGVVAGAVVAVLLLLLLGLYIYFFLVRRRRLLDLLQRVSDHVLSRLLERQVELDVEYAG